MFLNRGSYQSGQMGLTVNQLRELRRFESSTAHQTNTDRCVVQVGPCGAGVAHILGKNEAMGSNPITGSRSFRKKPGGDFLSGSRLIFTKLRVGAYKLLLPSSE